MLFDRKIKHTMKESRGAEPEGLFQYCVPFTVFVILLKYQLRHHSIVAKYSVTVLNTGKQAKLKDNTDAISFPDDEWVGLLCRCTSNGMKARLSRECSWVTSAPHFFFHFFFNCGTFILLLLPLVITKLSLLATISVP